MTAFERTVKAIKPFGHPYGPDLYEGEKKHYFVYNYSDNRGCLFGDNEPEELSVSVQVHFFLPMDENYLKSRNQIREALFREGFTYPEVTVETEKENNIRHIIFECDTTEEREV